MLKYVRDTPFCVFGICSHVLSLPMRRHVANVGNAPKCRQAVVRYKHEYLNYFRPYLLTGGGATLKAGKFCLKYKLATPAISLHIIVVVFLFCV